MTPEEANYTVLQESKELTGTLEPLTRQEDRYVRAWISGMEPKAAREYAALPVEWQISPAVQAAIDAFREEELRACLITKERLTMMFLESHAKASMVGDEIKATVELGKLHGLYESDKQKHARGGPVQVNVVQNASKLERLTDAELLGHANIELDSIDVPELAAAGTESELDD